MRVLSLILSSTLCLTMISCQTNVKPVGRYFQGVSAGAVWSQIDAGASENCEKYYDESLKQLKKMGATYYYANGLVYTCSDDDASRKMKAVASYKYTNSTFRQTVKFHSLDRCEEEVKNWKNESHGNYTVTECEEVN
ncbi:MAG: hypothetical protein RJA63_95 [Pseudomonadota bacterium]